MKYQPDFSQARGFEGTLGTGAFRLENKKEQSKQAIPEVIDAEKAKPGSYDCSQLQTPLRLFLQLFEAFAWEKAFACKESYLSVFEDGFRTFRQNNMPLLRLKTFAETFRMICGAYPVYARSPSLSQRPAPTTIASRSPFSLGLCSCSSSLSKMGI